MRERSMAERKRRRRTRIDGPDPIDAHVGERIRLRRHIQRMSQSDLAVQLGMSFQSVQKYERAGNRISASVLWRIAQALQVPVSFFFEGLTDADSAPPPMDPTFEDAMVETARLYQSVPTPIRSVLTQLIERIAKAESRRPPAA